MNRITQPVGVQQMTNVAIIRYRMNNKHFEIACYKNKAINWRNGVEKNLSEVLQIDKVFTSASHGDVASVKDLTHYFGKKTKEEIIKLILEKGELQLGEKERDVTINQNYLAIVKFIQEKCVHPISKRPFSQQSIEHAIGKLNFIVKSDQPVKKQALAVIKLLQEQFSLQRAQMKINITINLGEFQPVLQTIQELDITPDCIIAKGESTIELLIEPSKFRPLSQIMKEKHKKCGIEVLESDISNREVTDIENSDLVELEPRQQQKESAKSIPIEQLQKNPQAQEQQQFQQQQQQSKAFKCSMCPEASFETNAEFRQHYKSDWHNFNLKLKNQSLPTVSNEEYLEALLSEQIEL